MTHSDAQALIHAIYFLALIIAIVGVGISLAISLHGVNR